MLRIPVSETRLVILEWLKDPAAHFPSPCHGDPVTDGITSDAVAAKLGVPCSVADTHLTVLTAFGLLRTTQIRHRTFYRRDEARIAEVGGMFEKGWGPAHPRLSSVPPAPRRSPVERVRP